jgi:CubicO group peptidase (beta-lactamase class C family)
MFLFSYFLGNGEDGLHLTSSRDGYHWTALNQGRSFLAPQAGHKLMRDPCLLRGPDGVFHLVWTTGWGDRVIGYASSRDLIHWSPQQAIPVMMHEPTARNAWAPELFYDDERKQFLIFWASTIPGRFLETDRTGDDGWNHRIYATTTRDFKTFTPTRLFFDGGFNVIDATILKARGQYYLIVKDETKTPVKKNLRIARSAKAEGPYRDVSAPISVSWVEGPSSIQMGDEFLIYFDHYAAPQYYGALRSKDLVHWENVSQKVKFPQGTRHGTVLRVSEEVVARLASASPKHFPPAASSKRSDYFPPSENEGGWRTLLPLSGLPNADEKAEIRQKAGMDWDKLAAAWEFNAKTEKPSGLLVIRHGYVVGEWYKDCDRKRDFNIYSSSKSYTSVAFGLLMADSRVGKLQGGRTLTRDTKVCNEQWLPESLPLSDPRRARITVGHLLHMVSGLGGQHVPAQSPFEWCFGHVPGSPMATLIGEPGTVFNYSNADVSHLTVLFHRAEGRDLFPFLKERLFDPIGIKQIRWEEIGGNGKIGPFSQAYSGIFTTPREHAKFCHLALNKGRWAGKQIVPEDYYDLAWRGTSVKPDYGELWWVYPHHRDAPKDLVQTLGANSNNGYIIPSLDLVFVRLGESDKLPAGSEPLDAGLLKRVLAAVANSSR